MSQLTTIQQINIAEVSQYLCANDVAKGAFFGPRLTPSTPIALYMERKAVQWRYNLSNSDSTLFLTANYLYSLCKFNSVASNIVNSGGGGSVAPISPLVGIKAYDFSVAISGTLFINGQSTAQLPSTWKGLDIMFFRGGQIQTLTNNDYSWDSVNAILTISTPAIFSETFVIKPMI